MRNKILGLIALVLVGCGSAQDAIPDTITWSTEDPKYMAELARQMKSANISFRIESSGGITYAGIDAAKVDALHEKVENRISGNAVRYEPNEINLYLRKLLDERKIEYAIEKREEGEWTRWFPESDAQEKEVQDLVRQYAFRDTTDGECKAKAMPSNNALNKDAAQSRRTC